MKRIKDFDFKKIVKSVKKYASTNILFLSYIVIALTISFIMRLVTVTKPIYIKSFIGDLMIVIIIGSFGYFLKPKNQFKYFLSWLIFFTILTIGNTIYYRFYQSFLSINLIATASMVGQVNDAVFEKINIYHISYSNCYCCRYK